MPARAHLDHYHFRWYLHSGRLAAPVPCDPRLDPRVVYCQLDACMCALCGRPSLGTEIHKPRGRAPHHVTCCFYFTVYPGYVHIYISSNPIPIPGASAMIALAALNTISTFSPRLLSPSSRAEAIGNEPNAVKVAPAASRRWGAFWGERGPGPSDCRKPPSTSARVMQAASGLLFSLQFIQGPVRLYPYRRAGYSPSVRRYLPGYGDRGMGK